MQADANWARTGLMSVLTPINLWKAYPDLQKEKEIQKWRAEKFHKSSITFWAKNVSQPENKQKSEAITHNSLGITDLEFTSVLL